MFLSALYVQPICMRYGLWL